MKTVTVSGLKIEVLADGKEPQEILDSVNALLSTLNDVMFEQFKTFGVKIVGLEDLDVTDIDDDRGECEDGWSLVSEEDHGVKGKIFCSGGCGCDYTDPRSRAADEQMGSGYE